LLPFATWQPGVNLFLSKRLWHFSDLWSLSAFKIEDGGFEGDGGSEGVGGSDGDGGGL
jgi:hypothetical protein